LLTSKTALVTGSTSGIGLAIANALAGQGANVMLNGLGNAAEIEKARAAIEADHGVTAAFNGADMTKPSEIEALVKQTASTFGSDRT